MRLKELLAETEAQKEKAARLWREYRKKPAEAREKLLHHTLGYSAGVMGPIGWQDISVSVDGASAHYHISDIGDDSDDFLDFVEKLPSEADSWFSWSREPGSYDWFFSRRDELLYVEVPDVPAGIFIRYDDFVKSIRAGNLRETES